MEEIWYADATDLARMIREKVLSCREVVNLAEKVRCFHRRLGEAGIRKYTRAIT